jgi:hypothetical protein
MIAYQGLQVNRNAKQWNYDMSKQSEKGTQAQHDRFIEAARSIGADEDEAAFKAKLGVIARQKPKDPDSAPGKAPGNRKK